MRHVEFLEQLIHTKTNCTQKYNIQNSINIWSIFWLQIIVQWNWFSCKWILLKMRKSTQPCKVYFCTVRNLCLLLHVVLITVESYFFCAAWKWFWIFLLFIHQVSLPIVLYFIRMMDDTFSFLDQFYKCTLQVNYIFISTYFKIPNRALSSESAGCVLFISRPTSSSV